MMHDPISDCLTRLRNAARARKQTLVIPSSRIKRSILDILQREGFIDEYSEQQEGPANVFHVSMRYTPNGGPVLHGIRRVSRPGRRVYRGASDLEPVLNGLGHAIVSTSRGLITDAEARAQNVGGEVLCEVW